MSRGVFPGGSPVDPHLSSPSQGEERQRHVRSVLPPGRGELEGGLRTRRPILIEGYASLFGVPDASGDVVRAGAFARSLQRGTQLPMLLQHRPGAMVGRWVRMIEDGRGSMCAVSSKVSRRGHWWRRGSAASPSGFARASGMHGARMGGNWSRWTLSKFPS